MLECAQPQHSVLPRIPRASLTPVSVLMINTEQIQPVCPVSIEANIYSFNISFFRKQVSLLTAWHHYGLHHRSNLFVET